MKTYEETKKALQARRHNIRGFNAKFYRIFAHDLETARKGLEEAARLDKDFSITEFWQQSETHKTYFYRHNGGAYCELLQIIE